MSERKTRIAVYAIMEHKARVCYIGQTSRVVWQRVDNHIREAVNDSVAALSNERKRLWMLRAGQGRGLHVRVLAVCTTKHEAARVEWEWIERAIRAGWLLMNKGVATYVPVGKKASSSAGTI